jgi:ribonuclease BN (tRNA processing enzyme)
MKITILDSGTILASVSLTTPAYLLEHGDKKFLIDTSPDILHQLARHDLSFNMNNTNIIITNK